MECATVGLEVDCLLGTVLHFSLLNWVNSYSVM